jgi:hypothetical protein
MSRYRDIFKYLFRLVVGWLFIAVGIVLITLGADSFPHPFIDGKMGQLVAAAIGGLGLLILITGIKTTFPFR